jgi:hypothetical protein
VPATVSLALMYLFKDKLFTTALEPGEVSSIGVNTACGKKFRYPSARDRMHKIFDSRLSRSCIDSSASSDHNCLYVTPVEG